GTAAEGANEADGPLWASCLAQRREGGAGVVVLEDLGRVVAEIGHGLGAPLIEPHAVTVSAPGKPRDRAVDHHTEQRALERVIPDEPPQVIAPERRRALEAPDGDVGDPERARPLDHL